MFEKMRFFMSRLIFEILLKWPPAEEKIKGTLQLIARLEEKKKKEYFCCDRKMITDRSGSDGIFTSHDEFLRCSVCGTTKDIPDPVCDWEYLEAKRVIEEGGRYRYLIFPTWFGPYFFVAVCIVLSIVLVKLINGGF